MSGIEARYFPPITGKRGVFEELMKMNLEREEVINIGRLHS